MYMPLQNTLHDGDDHDATKRDPSKVYGIGHEVDSRRARQGRHRVGDLGGHRQDDVEARAARGHAVAVATGGGLVFGGDTNGHFRAYDPETGAVLWDVSLGSQVTGYPAAYAVAGKQYVAVQHGWLVEHIRPREPDARSATRSAERALCVRAALRQDEC